VSVLASPTTFSFDSLPLATLLVSLDGVVVAANAAVERVTGIAPEVLAGRVVADLAPLLADQWPALVDRARQDGESVAEVPYDDPRGPRVLQLVVALADAGGQPLAQVVLIDITARRAAEDAARGRVEVDEQHAAKQRLESLGLVAGGIAHDFNNLLVGVLAEASAAREDRSLSGSTREALRRIEAAARRMAQLTRQLLAYAGRGKFATMAVDPDDLLRELRDQLVRIVRSEATLEVTPGAGAIVIEADPALLRQVVVNLVANASDAQGHRVAVATRIVQREGTPWWQLEVSDDGAGIDGGTIVRIFEPFFSTKPGRHGLGLSAVHGIVRRLGGDVEVDSRPGQGARFRVRLPVIPGAEPPRRQKTDALQTTPRLAGMRVLVADDEPSVRATVRRLLERRGATVVVAADGLEAEARLRDEQFALVISDVSMPGRNGYEVLVVARATQPNAPVILMSGYTERTRGEGAEEEPDVFLEKPFTAKILDGVIDDVLKGN
jgi:two-component system, cell cycle sensor histidine kinase and response regulator CckA